MRLLNLPVIRPKQPRWQQHSLMLQKAPYSERLMKALWKQQHRAKVRFYLTVQTMVNRTVRTLL